MILIMSDQRDKANFYITVWAATASIGFIYMLLQQGIRGGDSSFSRSLQPVPVSIKYQDVVNVTKIQHTQQIEHCKNYSESIPSESGAADHKQPCLLQEELNILIGKCKERNVTRFLFIGDSRTQAIALTLGYIMLNGTSRCVTGASANERYKNVHCNNHCAGPDGLAVDFWWNARLNESLTDIFRNSSTTTHLRYENMKRPDVILITAGLHHFIDPSDTIPFCTIKHLYEMENNLTNFLTVLSEWGNNTFYVLQTPIFPYPDNKYNNRAYHAPLINLIATSALEMFPRVHKIELFHLGRQRGILRDGVHYDENSNKCFIQEILKNIC